MSSNGQDFKRLPRVHECPIWGLDMLSMSQGLDWIGIGREQDPWTQHPGRMGTSKVEVRELAVGFQSQCGSRSIPDMCCIALDVTQCFRPEQEETRTGPAPEPEPKALARNRIPARTLSTSSGPHTQITGTTDDVSEALTAFPMPRAYCGCGQGEYC